MAARGMLSKLSKLSKKKPNPAVGAAVEGLLLVLGVAKDASAAFPPLQSAIAGVVCVVGIIKVGRPRLSACLGAHELVLQKFQANDSDIKALESYVRQLQSTLSKPIFSEKRQCPSALQERIMMLARSVITQIPEW